jgi:hypothetical protein
LFAYPSSSKPAKKETIAKVATAVLSTTAKVKAREKKKAAAEGEPMDLVSSIFPIIEEFSSLVGREERLGRGNED